MCIGPGVEGMRLAGEGSWKVICNAVARVVLDIENLVLAMALLDEVDGGQRFKLQI